jgi:hypothetical protein
MFCDAKHKLLESGRFQLPDPAGSEPMTIDVTRLSLIINGIDLKSAKQRLRYQHAG